MTEQSPSVWLASIAEVFDGLGVEWTLVGALAANRYRATPRFTTDVDTMATHHSDLESVLVGAGYVLEVIDDEGEPAHSSGVTEAPSPSTSSSPWSPISSRRFTAPSITC